MVSRFYPIVLCLTFTYILLLFINFFVFVFVYLSWGFLFTYSSLGKMRYFNEPSEEEENPVYPCGICTKKVGQRRKAIQCDLCNFWNHIKCDEIDNKT